LKKLLFIPILLLVLFSCSPDEETICTDSELGVNCQGADYIQNSDSPYVLPWEIGKTFSIGQGNCTEGSHPFGQLQFAYDINMPIGTKIVAMRSGIVVKVIESYEDLESGTVGLLDEANLINVKHDDGI
jgi:murein DD-endopeptidase MepM/ murein hydrolase activator NlpD